MNDSTMGMKKFQLRLLTVAVWLIRNACDCMQRAILVLFVTIFIGMVQTVDAVQPVDSVRYNILLLSNSRQAMDQLQQSVAVNNWENVELRRSVQAYLKSFGMACWIDRRLDAGQLISVDFPAASLEQCLQKIAQATGAELGLIENVVVFAPRGQAAAMEQAVVLLHDQLLRSSNADSGVVQRILRWSKLTTPTELLQQISNQWGVELSSALPHDLMDEGELPLCTLATHLTLVAGGFGKKVTWDGYNFVFAELDVANHWQATYDSKELRPEAVAKAMRQSGRSIAKANDRSVTVRATTAVHRQLLAKSNNGPNRHRSAKSRDRKISGFEARDKPAAEVIQYVANGLGLRVQYDDTISESSKQRLISLTADNIRVDELVEQIGRAAEWAIQLKDGVLEVSHKP